MVTNENESKNRAYFEERHVLAGRIRGHFEDVTTRWKPPKFEDCYSLAGCVLVIRNYHKGQGTRRDPERELKERAVKAGHAFLGTLMVLKSLPPVEIAGDVTELREGIQRLLACLGGHRDPIKLLAEEVIPTWRASNNGRCPRSPEKNAPLCKVVAALFDETRIEPGSVSLSTVASILKGERRRGVR